MKHFGTVGRKRYIRAADDSTDILKTKKSFKFSTILSSEGP